MQTVRFGQILETLANHEVEFIVVGNVSAVLQGAPVTTFDLDIVHSRSDENLPRLLAALQDLDAFYREQSTRKIAPKISHLASPGRQLLSTRLGPLDVLGAIDANRDYESLIPFSTEAVLKSGAKVRVLNLDTLIEFKQNAGRPKDLAVLPVLKRTLEERRET